MDRASAHPGSIPVTSKCFTSSRVLGKEMELLKLHDLASPSRKNQVLALPTIYVQKL